MSVQCVSFKNPPIFNQSLISTFRSYVSGSRCLWLPCYQSLYFTQYIQSFILYWYDKSVALLLVLVTLCWGSPPSVPVFLLSSGLMRMCQASPWFYVLFRVCLFVQFFLEVALALEYMRMTYQFTRIDLPGFQSHTTSSRRTTLLDCKWKFSVLSFFLSLFLFSFHPYFLPPSFLPFLPFFLMDTEV